jgi:hypothetical protein
MKIKLQDSTTNGYIGSVEFKDGVSVHPVSPRQANQFKAAISGVQIVQDDGETVDEVLNNMFPIIPRGYYEDAGLEVPSQYLTYWDGTYPKTFEPEVEVAPETPTVAPASAALYTREQLEAIADQQGIVGLREIATPLGIKGKSIVELIEELVAYVPSA